MSRTFEHIYPWLFAFGAAMLAWSCDARLPADPNFASLLSAAISVSAILVGFLATMKSILMALPAAVQKVRDGGYMEDLVSFLAQSISGNLLFCTLNLAAFFSWVSSYLQWFAVAWIALAIFCVLSFWRITRIMTLLLRMS